jgi:hypothetical protein
VFAWLAVRHGRLRGALDEMACWTCHLYLLLLFWCHCACATESHFLLCTPTAAHVQALAYYENPMRSGVVLGHLVGLYVLLGCDVGVTFLFIGTQGVLYATTTVLVLAVVKFVIDRKYHGIANPTPFPQQLLEPVFSAASDLLAPLCVSEDAAVDAVKAVYACLPAAQAHALSVLFCTSFRKTAKVISASVRVCTIPHAPGRAYATCAMCARERPSQRLTRSTLGLPSRRCLFSLIWLGWWRGGFRLPRSACSALWCSSQFQLGTAPTRPTWIMLLTLPAGMCNARPQCFPLSSAAFSCPKTNPRGTEGVAMVTATVRPLALQSEEMCGAGPHRTSKDLVLSFCTFVDRSLSRNWISHFFCVTVVDLLLVRLERGKRCAQTRAHCT